MNKSHAAQRFGAHCYFVNANTQMGVPPKVDRSPIRSLRRRRLTYDTDTAMAIAHNLESLSTHRKLCRVFTARAAL